MKSIPLGNSEIGVLARMMRTVEFFSPLTVSQIEQVLPHIRLHEFAPGETVFKQGEEGDAFYIVCTGSVCVQVKKGFLSFSKKVASLSPGAFFGENALISREPRGATVVCETPAQLFVLVASDFQFILNQNPAALAAIKAIGERRKFDSAHQ